MNSAWCSCISALIVISVSNLFSSNGACICCVGQESPNERFFSWEMRPLCLGDTATWQEISLQDKGQEEHASTPLVWDLLLWGWVKFTNLCLWLWLCVEPDMLSMQGSFCKLWTMSQNMWSFIGTTLVWGLLADRWVEDQQEGEGISFSE
jgi:hypothetical protein